MSVAEFRRLFLIGAGFDVSQIPPTISEEDWRELSLRALADLGSGGGTTAWDQVTGKPTSFDTLLAKVSDMSADAQTRNTKTDAQLKTLLGIPVGALTNLSGVPATLTLIASALDAVSGYGLTAIPDNWQSGASTLKGLSIGQGVTTIGNSAFQYCTGLTGSLTIPDSVTTIGDYAFSNCTGLTGSLTIPDSVTTIGSYAFYSCSGLTSLTIPNSVTTIGNSAFQYCSGLTSVNCRITKAVFDATAGAVDMFVETSSDLVLHALPGTGWSAGTDLTIGGNTSVDVVLDLT